MPTTDTQTSPLAQEIATYNAHKSALLESAPGKIVVIQKDRIIGTFDTDKQAFDYAYQTLGRTRFLVRPVQEEDEVIYLSGSALGLSL